MLRSLRGFLRWQFATEAVVLVLASVHNIGELWRFPDIPWGAYLVYPTTLVFAVMLGTAWYATRRSRPGRSHSAIASCLVNIGLIGLLLWYIEPKRSSLFAFNSGILLANAAGVWAFWRFAPPDVHASRGILKVVGDRTGLISERVITIIFLLLVWEAWRPLDLWALHRGLRNPGFFTGLALWLFACFLVAALHECGHALAASSFGMRLTGFKAGPVQWRKQSGRWKFKLSGDLFGGAVSVVPLAANRSDWNDAWVIGAGPLANLCSAPVFFWAMFRAAHSPRPEWWTLLSMTATLSILIPILNLFPFRSGEGAYSDGARLLQIFTHSPALEYVRTIERIQSTLFTPARLRDMDPEALRNALPYCPTSVAKVHLHFCAAQIFEERGLIAEAARALQEAEVVYEREALNLPPQLHTCFIYFYAAHQHDAAAARLWWERMHAKNIERKNIDYWLSSSALAWCEGRLGEAEENWLKANGEAQALPNAGAYESDRERVRYLRKLLDAKPVSTFPEITTETLELNPSR